MDDTAKAVTDAYSAIPITPRRRLLEMRTQIYLAAKSTNTEPLTETLKWGQPSYVPRKSDGTTIRLAWSDKRPEVCGMYVHCQTSLIGQFETLFPDAFEYQDNRGVLVPTEGTFSLLALQKLASIALTYHRNK